MASIPWRSCSPADPNREYLVLLSFLPLKRRWRIPWLLPKTFRITRQLRRSAGLVGYSLYATLTTGHFWTLSVWDDEAALQEFVHAEPHRGTMRVMLPHMGRGSSGGPYRAQIFPSVGTRRCAGDRPVGARGRRDALERPPRRARPLVLERQQRRPYQMLVRFVERYPAPEFHAATADDREAIAVHGGLS